jgi:DNA-binding CsgD family transcriptional regulator
MEVLYALHRVALSEVAGGDWRAARRSADDAISLARSIGHPAMTVAPTAVLMLLAALEGDSEFEALRTATEQGLAQHHVGIMEPVVRDLLRWGQGTRAAYDGAATEAFHHLAQIRMPAVQRVAVQPRTAGAVHAKELDQAAAWTAETEELANAINLPWAHAVAHHGQALLTSGEQASGHFEAALAQHALSGRLFDQACTQLAYGEHLRRGGKRVEARSHLSKALETFRDLRAGPLIERATRELRASGETARRRDPSTLVQLTPTELNIAQLVSQGLSNKEVAAQAWISPRTVAFHLRNVFTKTGVTSRGELARLDLG